MNHVMRCESMALGVLDRFVGVLKKRLVLTRSMTGHVSDPIAPFHRRLPETCLNSCTFWRRSKRR